MTDSRPTYWSIDAETYAMWVAVLGTAAAGKLMAACAAYFFDGTEPDGFKLTKQARAMFEGERGRMERRRASATNGRKGGRKDVENPRAENVENSTSCEETPKKSRKSSGKAAKKSPKNPTPIPAPTCDFNKSRLTPILNLNPNLNPQTPAPRDRGAGSGGSVTPAEFAAMLGAGLGYDVPTAYGATLRAV